MYKREVHLCRKRSLHRNYSFSRNACILAYLKAFCARNNSCHDSFSYIFIRCINRKLFTARRKQNISRCMHKRLGALPGTFEKVFFAFYIIRNIRTAVFFCCFSFKSYIAYSRLICGIFYVFAYDGGIRVRCVHNDTGFVLTHEHFHFDAVHSPADNRNVLFINILIDGFFKYFASVFCRNAYYMRLFSFTKPF